MTTATRPSTLKRDGTSERLFALAEAFMGLNVLDTVGAGISGNRGWGWRLGRADWARAAWAKAAEWARGGMESGAGDVGRGEGRRERQEALAQHSGERALSRKAIAAYAMK